MRKQNADLPVFDHDQLQKARNALTQLIEILQREQKALKQRDKESLFETLQSKQAQVEKVASILQYLGKNGKKAIKTPLKSNRKTHASHFSESHSPNEQNLWQEIQYLAHHVVEINQENANIIRLSRSFFYEYLKRLKDFRQHAVCYQKQHQKGDILLNNLIINRMS